MLLSKEEWSKCAEESRSDMNAPSDFLSLGSSLCFAVAPEAQNIIFFSCDLWNT